MPCVRQNLSRCICMSTASLTATCARTAHQAALAKLLRCFMPIVTWVLANGTLVSSTCVYMHGQEGAIPVNRDAQFCDGEVRRL